MAILIVGAVRRKPARSPGTTTVPGGVTGAVRELGLDETPGGSTQVRGRFRPAVQRGAGKRQSWLMLTFTPFTVVLTSTSEYSLPPLPSMTTFSPSSPSML